MGESAQNPTFPRREDIPTLSDEELGNLLVQVKKSIIGVTRQLNAYADALNPEHMSTYQWANKARKAKLYYIEMRDLIRSELSNRERVRRRGIEARRAAAQPVVDSSYAFVKVAERVLGKDECEKLWAAAREEFPEAFEEDDPPAWDFDEAAAMEDLVFREIKGAASAERALRRPHVLLQAKAKNSAKT